jgi:uncharacterized protein YicC (UPF0701 family)
LTTFFIIFDLFRKLYDTINDGFGKLLCNYQTKKNHSRRKSLNSKGLDLNVRMPSCNEMELGLRNQIALKLERGKVDFSIFIESTTEQTSTKVNVPIVKAYINQLREVYADADETELMKMAVRMPDTMKIERDR